MKFFQKSVETKKCRKLAECLEIIFLGKSFMKLLIEPWIFSQQWRSSALYKNSLGKNWKGQFLRTFLWKQNWHLPNNEMEKFSMISYLLNKYSLPDGDGDGRIIKLARCKIILVHLALLNNWEMNFTKVKSF